MTDLNSVNIIGRLTRDGDQLQYMANGNAVENISIAVNRGRKNEDGSNTDDVSYFDVVIYGKTAENLKPYLLKGKQVGITGYLKQDRWEKDGQRFNKVRIVANTIELLGGNSQARQQGGYPQQGMAQPKQQANFNMPPEYGAPQRQYQAPPQSYTRPAPQGYPAPAQMYPDQQEFPEDIPF